MATAGANVFRLNCSHAGVDEITRHAELIRRHAPTGAILLDLQGPKLRTGNAPLTFVAGTRTALSPDDLTFDPIEAGLRRGHRLLLGDGRIEVVLVDDPATDGVEVETIRGGSIAARQGVHLPDTAVTYPAFAQHDERYIDVANTIGAEWVALSFVRDAADISSLRDRLDGRTGIVAKIERREALANLETIIEAADAVMAARGDLGVEIPFEDVPRAQRRIADTALQAGKPAICATEMLESMRTSNRPTRAEVADVSAAVVQGYGAVMLSAETATGEHPIETVTAMRRICDATTAEIGYRIYADLHPGDSAVSAAAAALATRIGADAILSLTYTGYSAEILSACRPPIPVIAATPAPEVARRLQLHWGIRPLVVERPEKMRGAVEDARNAAVRCGMLASDASLVVTASRDDPGEPADTIWWQPYPGAGQPRPS
jgi:pyruvate kinase